MENTEARLRGVICCSMFFLGLRLCVKNNIMSALPMCFHSVYIRYYLLIKGVCRWIGEGESFNCCGCAHDATLHV